ncbi:phage tail spike protein [Clostridium neuense]|uniref:Phage tail spike protein n=1 Tax=Clostridium neuense TaxID=1728934 RepID=A0ABW8TKF3_9CLOT
MAYKISIFNNDVETIIHYPTAEKEAPHLDKMDLVEKDNDVDSFSFSIPINNPGYNLLQDYKTKIKIIDVSDNSIRFVGRILNPTESMGTGGFYKSVPCESALAYLLDSNSRTTAILGDNLRGALTKLLAMHNNAVETDKQIQLGNVDVTLNNIAYGCNFEPVLNAILNILKNVKEYHLRIRETNGVLYLDCLQSLSSNTADVRLGENMKELIKSKDISQLATRIIPLGANNLDISGVNGGVDYIEDLTAKGLYGVIEKTISYSDITDATTLKSTATADISNYTQPLITLQIDALDLSKLTGIKANEFMKGMSLHIINSVMAIDTVVKIVVCDVDLTKEYNPKLTLSNIPQTMQDIVSGIQNSSLSNDSTHRGVQVGDSFGIRVAGDKNITLLSGDTFEMSRKSDNVKVLYFDEEGNVNGNDCTFNDMKVKDSFAVYHGDKKVMEIGYYTGVVGDVKQIKFEKAAIIEGMDTSNIEITAANLYFGEDGNRVVADTSYVNNRVNDSNNWWYDNYFQNAKDGTFTSQDGKTITVTKGIVTDIQ